ncbi:glycosyl transferase [Niastella vici]|uniref:Glycosyl transferase n=1 Tax=Niastella vici TaxID=1703345 RepID=A0A1V9G9S5_9BACT|nr:nucleotide disphospho-sugar-binding domain-containing protein [Niastella vici]OQP67284.1 glycosyl transferase [Niastella vici]
MKDTWGIGSLAGKKILFANFPADGHFNPLTGIAVYLQQLGCDVRWYAAQEYAGKIKKLSIPHYPFQKAMEVTGSNLEQVFPERKQIKNAVRKLNFDIQHLFIMQAEEYYADILEINQTFPFDLLICDNAFTAIPFIKDKMQKPVIAIGVLPLTETSKDLPPAGLGITPSNTFAGKIKQVLLRYLTKQVLFKGSNRLLYRIMEKQGLEHHNHSVFDIGIKKSSLLLQSGTPSFEYKRSDLGKNIRFIGPLLPYSTQKHNQCWFDERLKQYRKIVVLTQGTVEKDVTKLLVPTLESLKNTDTLVICTTGGSQTHELKTAYPHPNLIIEDFIPFNEVMPYAHAYITNGGYGGVMLGIENKLPLVVAGVHEGKNEICARVGYFNLGINLKTERPNLAQIRHAVENVIGNPLYKKNVEALSREFARYNPNELVARYVAELLEPLHENRIIKRGINNLVVI